MPILLAQDFGLTTLAGPISNTSVVANLASGSGTLFPSPSNGQYFVLTFNDTATKQFYEIVWVTGRTGDTITMLRGQEGTTALGWSAGDLVYNNMTSGQLLQLAQIFTYSGSNPNGFVAGTAGIGTLPPTICWAAANHSLWYCSVTGPAAAVVWVLANNFNSVLSTTGYRIASDGFIQQWGQIYDPINLNALVTFPIPFPNKRVNVTFQNQSQTFADEATVITLGINAFDAPNPLTQFQWIGYNSTLETENPPGNFLWMAWGY